MALIFAIIVGHLFHYLAGKGLKFKMPEGVPPMVSESFEPIFISMIIVTFAFVVRVGFGYTPFGNFLSFSIKQLEPSLLKLDYHYRQSSYYILLLIYYGSLEFIQIRYIVHLYHYK